MYILYMYLLSLLIFLYHTVWNLILKKVFICCTIIIYIYIYQTGARQEAGNQTLIIRVEIIVVDQNILYWYPHGLIQVFYYCNMFYQTNLTNSMMYYLNSFCFVFYSEWSYVTWSILLSTFCLLLAITCKKKSFIETCKFTLNPVKMIP